MPYKPTDARSCRLGATRRAGPGSVLGVWVVGTRCRTAKRVVRRYQRCLNSKGGRDRGCYSRIDKPCVRPVFLGRCWLRDRFFRRQVQGYRCTERRLYEVQGLYEGRVSVAGRGSGASATATRFTTGSPSRSTRSPELRAAWGNPRVTAIDVTADIFLRACEVGDPMRESARPVLLDGHGHTLRQTCFEKRLLRQDGTGFVELRNVTLTRGGSDGPGGAVDDARRDHRDRLQGPRRTLPRSRAAASCRSAGRRSSARSSPATSPTTTAAASTRAAAASRCSTRSSTRNLVDGSGGAIGSTGDILVVRSHRRRQHDRRRRRSALRRRGRRHHRDRLDRRAAAPRTARAARSSPSMATSRSSTPPSTGNRADDRGGADLRRGRRDDHQLDDRAQRWPSPRRRRRVGARRPCTSPTRRSATTTPRAWAAALLPAAASRSSTRRSSTTSRRWRRTSAPASGSTPSARSSAPAEAQRRWPGPADRRELPGADREVARVTTS